MTKAIPSFGIAFAARLLLPDQSNPAMGKADVVRTLVEWQTEQNPLSATL